MTQKVIDVVGVSTESFAKAAENAVTEAAKTVRGLRWARVAELEMALDGKKITLVSRQNSKRSRRGICSRKFSLQSSRLFFARKMLGGVSERPEDTTIAATDSDVGSQRIPYAARSYR